MEKRSEHYMYYGIVAFNANILRKSEIEKFFFFCLSLVLEELHAIARRKNQARSLFAELNGVYYKVLLVFRFFFLSMRML